MSIRGSNFENQHPFASDHALVWERCMPDGLLYGVEMSFTPTLFTLGTGFMLVAGRMFEITAAENISISPGNGYARVYVTIDTGGTATENSFGQVSFGVDYAANLDSFAELTQGEININQGAAVYQAEVAVLAINSSGVTAIERQMELVSPGAGTGAFAAIAVTYPAGSTVTVTDGKITYTAPNTNGAALFVIPYAATWVITSTDGTETASETVEITTEGQVEKIELSYGMYFIRNGVIQPGFQFEIYDNREPVAITENAAGYVEISIEGYYNGANQGAAYLPNVIPLVGYSKLCIDYVSQFPGYSTKLDEYSNCVGLQSAIPSSNNVNSDTYEAYVTCPSAERATAELELTNYQTGDYYISIGVFSSKAGTGNTMQIYNLWLE